MSITFDEELLMAEEKTKQDKKGRLLALRDQRLRIGLIS